MPYVSDAQRKYFNANREEIGSKVVDEYNKASKGKKLPNKSHKKNKRKSKVRHFKKQEHRY